MSDSVEDEMLEKNRVAFDSYLSAVSPLPDDDTIATLTNEQTRQSFRTITATERAGARSLLSGIVDDLRAQGLLARNVSITFSDDEIDRVTESLLEDQIDGASFR